MKISLFFLICGYLTASSHAFYFFLEGGERKCFYKDLSQNNLLIGRYKLQLHNSHDNTYFSPSLDIGVLIDVEETFDDDHRIVHQKGSANGEFSFTALDDGEHRICLTPAGLGYFSKVKSKLHFDYTFGDASSIDSKSTDKVQSLQNQIIHLTDKLIDIRREQKFMREREASFRDQSEATNERVVRWSIFQLIVLVITCLWQLRYLQTFFIKQKVI